MSPHNFESPYLVTIMFSVMASGEFNSTWVQDGTKGVREILTKSFKID